MRKCPNISPYMRRPLVMYDFATAPLWISLHMRKVWFSFLSVYLNLPPPKCKVQIRLNLYSSLIAYDTVQLYIYSASQPQRSAESLGYVFFVLPIFKGCLVFFWYSKRALNELLRARLSCNRMIRLLAHLLPLPFPVSKLSFFLNPLSNDREKAWPSVNHLLLSGCTLGCSDFDFFSHFEV